MCEQRPVPAFFVALAFAGMQALTGCGDRVCIQWSEAEGACPPAEEADRFIAPSCDETVTFDLDEEGDFDGDVCCYDVEKEEDDTGFCDEF